MKINWDYVAMYLSAFIVLMLLIFVRIEPRDFDDKPEKCETTTQQEGENV